MATPLHTSHEQHDMHGEPHAHGSVLVYTLVLLALTVLMILTIVAAKHDLEGFWFLSGTAVNQIVALAIALTKAWLVVYFFMAFRFGTPLIKVWAMAGFAFMPLMFFILGDYFTRKYEPAPSWEPLTAEMRTLPPSSPSWKSKPQGGLPPDVTKPAKREPWVNLNPGVNNGGFFAGQNTAKE